jgi:hypothetical protein
MLGLGVVDKGLGIIDAGLKLWRDKHCRIT